LFYALDGWFNEISDRSAARKTMLDLLTATTIAGRGWWAAPGFRNPPDKLIRNQAA